MTDLLTIHPNGKRKAYTIAPPPERIDLAKRVVAQALAELGDTPESAARRIIETRARGVRRSTTDGPLAIYLAQAVTAAGLRVLVVKTSPDAISVTIGAPFDQFTREPTDAAKWFERLFHCGGLEKFRPALQRREIPMRGVTL